VALMLWLWGSFLGRTKKLSSSRSIGSPCRKPLSRVRSNAWFAPVWAHLGSNPSRKLFATQLASRKAYDHTLLLVNSGCELVTIEEQKHFHRQMPNSLVAIKEWMIADQRESQGRRLRWHAWIEVLPTGRHVRLNDSRLKASEIANAIKPASLLQGEAMKSNTSSSDRCRIMQAADKAPHSSGANTPKLSETAHQGDRVAAPRDAAKTPPGASRPPRPGA
jgi:hypothetical protein